VSSFQSTTEHRQRIREQFAEWKAGRRSFDQLPSMLGMQMMLEFQITHGRGSLNEQELVTWGREHFDPFKEEVA